MKRRFTILGIVLLVCGGVWYVFRTSPKHYSRTPSEVMHNLAIAVNSNDPNQVFALFANAEAFDDFMNLPTDSYASKNAQTPLIRHKGQSALYAWQQWFKKYGLSALIYKISLESIGGIVCTTKSNQNFMLDIEYVDQGYLITKCAYEV